MNRLTFDSQVHRRRHHGDRPRPDRGAGPRPRQTGKMCNANWHDYKIPTAMDVPAEHRLAADRPAGHRGNSDRCQGARRAGDDPDRRPPIANAVYDATGVRIHDSPITPARLVERLLAAAAGRRGDHAAELSPTSVPDRRRGDRGARRRPARAPTPAAPTCSAACATGSSAPRSLVSLPGLAELKGISRDDGRRPARRRPRRRSPRSPASPRSRSATPRSPQAADRGREPAAPQPGDARRQPLPAPALLVLPRRLPLRRRKGGDICYAVGGENQLPRHLRRRPLLHRPPLRHRAGAGRARRAGDRSPGRGARAPSPSREALRPAVARPTRETVLGAGEMVTEVRRARRRRLRAGPTGRSARAARGTSRSAGVALARCR